MSVLAPSMSDADLWRSFVAALLAEHKNALCDFGLRSGKIAADSHILNRMLDEGNKARLLRLWDNDRNIVVSRRLQKQEKFADACQAARVAGWPVAVRQSGGTTVVHRPGVLNVTLFQTQYEHRKLSTGFDELCEVIVKAAARLGVNLEAGRLSRVYCAGSHDVGWRGCKIAGTAAVAKRRGALRGALHHASIVVYGDWRSDIETISNFERDLGLPANYEVNAHSSLSEAVFTEGVPSSKRRRDHAWENNQISPYSSG